jgi:hypothetical protein
LPCLSGKEDPLSNPIFTKTVRALTLALCCAAAACDGGAPVDSAATVQRTALPGVAAGERAAQELTAPSNVADLKVNDGVEAAYEMNVFPNGSAKLPVLKKISLDKLGRATSSTIVR